MVAVSQVVCGCGLYHIELPIVLTEALSTVDRALGQPKSIKGRKCFAPLKDINVAVMTFYSRHQAFFMETVDAISGAAFPLIVLP